MGVLPGQTAGWGLGTIPSGGQTVNFATGGSTANNTLFAIIVDSTGNPMAVTDQSGGNAFTQDVQQASQQISIWRLTNCPAGITGILVKPTSGSLLNASIVVLEASGLLTVSPVDKTNSGNATTTTPSISTAATTNANDLVLAAAQNSSGTAHDLGTPAGYTNLYDTGNVARSSEACYAVVSATGVQSATWSNVSGSVTEMVIAAYKMTTPPITISAELDSVSTWSCTAVLAQSVSAECDATSATAVIPALAQAVSAACGGTASASATATNAQKVSAECDATSTAAVTPALAQRVSAECDGASTASATPTLAQAVSATCAATSTATVTPTLAQTVSAQCNGTSAAQATATLAISVSCSISGISAATATATLAQTVSCSIAATSSISVTPTMAQVVSAAFSGVSAGTVTAIIIPPFATPGEGRLLLQSAFVGNLDVEPAYDSRLTVESAYVGDLTLS